MQTPARHSIDCLVEQRIWNCQFFVILFAMLVIFAAVEGEFFDIGQTKRFSSVTFRRQPKLIHLTSSVNIEFQIGRSECGSELAFLFHVNLK
jgi:hypothetical protein